MVRLHDTRAHRAAFAFGGVILAFFCAPLQALVKFDDGHDELFVTGSVGVSYDSNIFATSGGDGDTSYNAGLDIEYRRKAGMIGVDGDIGWNFSKFGRFSSEDFANPHLHAELTKDSGRTTGSLTAGIARESRAETAINVRTTSWNYESGLNFKYPVIDRYSISGQFGYDLRDYTGNTALVDVTSYNASTDLFYVYTSERDLLAGYRFRVTDTTGNTRDYDHAFTVGMSGRIIPKLNGTVRFGYQLRESDHHPGKRETFGSFTSSASTTWTISKRLNLTGQLSQDFSTLATDVSVDTKAAGLDAQFAMTSKFSIFGGVSYGHTRFLGLEGGGRRDTYGSANAGLSYSIREYLKATLSYVYYKNWSTLRISDYDRHSISLNLTSRW